MEIRGKIVLVNKLCGYFYTKFRLFAMIFVQEKNIKYGAKLIE
jgi:hypothetical protein